MRLGLARGYALEEMPCKYHRLGLLHETFLLRVLSTADSVGVVQLLGSRLERELSHKLSLRHCIQSASWYFGRSLPTALWGM